MIMDNVTEPTVMIAVRYLGFNIVQQHACLDAE